MSLSAELISAVCHRLPERVINCACPCDQDCFADASWHVLLSTWQAIILENPEKFQLDRAMSQDDVEELVSMAVARLSQEDEPTLETLRMQVCQLAQAPCLPTHTCYLQTLIGFDATFETNNVSLMSFSTLVHVNISDQVLWFCCQVAFDAAYVKRQEVLEKVCNPSDDRCAVIRIILQI